MSPDSKSLIRFTPTRGARILAPLLGWLVYSSGGQTAVARSPSTTLSVQVGSNSPADDETAAAPRGNPGAGHLVVPYGDIPLSFEANAGQASERYSHLAHGVGFSALFGGSEVLFSFAPVGARGAPGAVEPLRMRLVGARRASRPTGEHQLPGNSNYFMGTDRSRWRADIPTFRRLKVPSVYPGIDVVYYGNHESLEYDFIVASGADPSRIVLEFEGARRLSVDGDGNLVIELAGGRLVQKAPVAVEQRDGRRRPVECKYRLLDEGRVGLSLGAYDERAELLIDPVLGYATYFGGDLNDAALDVAVGPDGAAYIVGWTESSNLPVTEDGFDGSKNGIFNVFVTKVDPSGMFPVYSTYIGGSFVDEAYGIAVDNAGNAYITGYTQSNDWPVHGAIDATYAGGGGIGVEGGDVFVAKLNPTGTALVYSTYLGGGGADMAREIAVDPAGNAVVAGFTRSSDFPTQAPMQANNGSVDSAFSDAFVLKVNAAGTSLVYSTYLGGASQDDAFAVAVDATGAAYVGGSTLSDDFPVLSAFSGKSGTDGFVAKFTADGSLSYSARLGGKSYDSVYDVAVDARGSVYATGETESFDFAVTPDAFQRTRNGVMFCLLTTCPDAFLTKLAPEGDALEYSTYFGGFGDDAAAAVAVDAVGYIHLAGTTGSVDLPNARAVQSRSGGGKFDGFVARFTPDGGLSDATYLGGGGSDKALGIAVDLAGNAYVTGWTDSRDFPVKDAIQAHGDPFELDDAFLAKLVYGSTPVAGGRVVPDAGGDTGFVTVTLYGADLALDASFRLMRPGEDDIVPLMTAVAPDGTSIVGVVDLRGAARGPWDVLIASGSTELTYPAGFRVEAGREPELWVEFLGRDRVRPGLDASFTMLYGNTGNIDAIAVPLWISGLPRNADVHIESEVRSLPLPAGVEETEWEGLEAVHVTETDQRIAVVAPHIPPGVTRSLQLTVDVDSAELDHEFTLFGSAGPPLVESAASPEVGFGQLTGCLMAMVGEAINLVPGGHCAESLVKGSSEGRKVIGKWLGSAMFVDVPLAAMSAHHGHAPVLSLSQVAVGGLTVLAECAGKEVLGTVGKGLELVIGGLEILEQCHGLVRQLAIAVIRALDPNDKVGITGGGDVRALRSGTPLAYEIFFENEADASAPAREVVVTDDLPPELDLSTLRLGQIKIADRVLDPPPGVAEFVAQVDLRATQWVIVQVEAELDVAARRVTWRFTSLDPETGLPPEDPSAGFLPPDVSPPQGEGSVMLFVDPRPGLPAGTRIDNRARIVFDANAPIDTPVWSNMIDGEPPASRVVDTASVSHSPVFEVRWAGTDVGSGIASYDVYVSRNGSEMEPWIVGTTITQAQFEGVVGGVYAFAAVSHDFAGNAEIEALAPEVTVTVEAEPTVDSCDCRSGGAPTDRVWWMMFTALLLGTHRRVATAP